MRAVGHLVKAGTVRDVGVSNVDLPLLERAMRVRRIDSLQPPCNSRDEAGAGVRNLERHQMVDVLDEYTPRVR